MIFAVSVLGMSAFTPAAYADPVFTVFTDKAAWEAAVAAKSCQFNTERFSDLVLNFGIGVVSDAGFINNQLWDDQLRNSVPIQETTWDFTPDIMGWGGNFDAGPLGAGSSIDVETINGGTFAAMNVPNTASGEFFGFTSDTNFMKVFLTTPGTQELHQFQNLRRGR